MDEITAAMEQGEFAQAVTLLEQRVARAPDDGQVFMLFELRALIGDFAGARAALEMLWSRHPEMRTPMALLARCVDGDEAWTRRRFDPDGAKQGWATIGAPPPFALMYAKAAAQRAAGDHAGVAATLAEVAPAIPRVSGVMVQPRGRQVRFSDLRDMDDLTGPLLPCVAARGPLDLPFAIVRAVQFDPPRGYQDTLWKPCLVVLHDGTQLDARVPSLYPGSGRHASPWVRQGRESVFDRDAGYAVAYGQRDYSVTTADGGRLMVGVHQIEALEFDPPARIAPAARPETNAARPSFWRRLFGGGGGSG